MLESKEISLINKLEDSIKNFSKNGLVPRVVVLDKDGFNSLEAELESRYGFKSVRSDDLHKETCDNVALINVSGNKILLVKHPSTEPYIEVFGSPVEK